MAIRSHPAGYHCAKALRDLGLGADAIGESLRHRLALDTGEIDAVLSWPVTPAEGVPLVERRELRDDIAGPIPRRRRNDDMTE